MYEDPLTGDFPTRTTPEEDEKLAEPHVWRYFVEPTYSVRMGGGHGRDLSVLVRASSCRRGGTWGRAGVLPLLRATLPGGSMIHSLPPQQWNDASTPGPCEQLVRWMVQWRACSVCGVRTRRKSSAAGLGHRPRRRPCRRACRRPCRRVPRTCAL